MYNFLKPLFDHSNYRPLVEAECGSRLYHPELRSDKNIDALSLFADNLCHSDKGTRVATLRILCHYEPLICDIKRVREDQPVGKKMKTEASQTCPADSQICNV